jgi:hypothetical protein
MAIEGFSKPERLMPTSEVEDAHGGQSLKKSTRVLASGLVRSATPIWMSKYGCKTHYIPSKTTTHGGRERVVVRRGKYLLAMVAVLTLAVLAASFFSAGVQRAYTNKTVFGIVHDQAGNPLPGANVTVEIWGGFWPDQAFFRISNSTVTNGQGYYEVTFSSNYWDPHNTIKVIATYDSDQKIKKVEADEALDQEVNVFMNVTIPEFSTPLGLMTMTAVCMVSIVILLARRRR